MEITLEDVESAIMVLREFLKKQRDAQRILRQLGIREGRTSGMPFSFDSFVEQAYQQVRAKQMAEGKGEVEPLGEVSEQDLARMREIAKKRKGEVKDAPITK